MKSRIGIGHIGLVCLLFSALTLAEDKIPVEGRWKSNNIFVAVGKTESFTQEYQVIDSVDIGLKMDRYLFSKINGDRLFVDSFNNYVSKLPRNRIKEQLELQVDLFNGSVLKIASDESVREQLLDQAENNYLEKYRTELRNILKVEMKKLVEEIR